MHFLWLFMHSAHGVFPSHFFLTCTQRSQAFRSERVVEAEARRLSLNPAHFAAGTGASAGRSLTREPPNGAQSGLSTLSGSERERPLCRPPTAGVDPSVPLPRLRFPFPPAIHRSEESDEDPSMASSSSATPPNGASSPLIAVRGVVERVASGAVR